MPGADSALGIDCHPKCEPAPGKAAKVRIFPMQSSAGCCTRAARSHGKQKATGEGRVEHWWGRAVHPTELFVITALKIRRCTDWDCRHSPYLSCKALLIRQYCGWLFLPSYSPRPFPSKRSLDQQPQFTQHFTSLPACIWEERASFGLGARACLGASSLTPRAPELSTHRSSGDTCTRMGRAAFVNHCPPPGPLFLTVALGFLGGGN